LMTAPSSSTLFASRPIPEARCQSLHATLAAHMEPRPSGLGSGRWLDGALGPCRARLGSSPEPRWVSPPCGVGSRKGARRGRTSGRLLAGAEPSQCASLPAKSLGGSTPEGRVDRVRLQPFTDRCPYCASVAAMNVPGGAPNMPRACHARSDSLAL
jgi:hypothetical protein